MESEEKSNDNNNNNNDGNNNNNNNNGGKFGIWENIFRNHHNTLKSLFHRNKPDIDAADVSVDSPKPIPQLSPIANSVVSRCSKIIGVSTDELQHAFDSELPLGVKELLTYARNLVEFCSFKALHKFSRTSDYLSDSEFRSLSFDVMLAWEAPSVNADQVTTETSTRSNCKDSKDETSGDEDDASLFYSSSTNMAVQVDDKKTVGREAFSRIAPVCILIADIITVHNLFDALTNSSGHRLHFLVYDKYIRSLDKVIRNSKNVLASSVGNLQLAEEEMVLDVDGTIPTQPVLQHIGIGAWPGRLTLTNYALYFESLGVGVHEKAVRYDLGADMKQVIKPDLTGPLGARLFDKAVMYKSTSVAEPVYFEFPEFKANLRRDYWLDISLEILRAHMFVRKFGLKDTQKSEVLARASLGIFRYRALKEAFKFFSSNYKTLLTFNLAETLPRGDIILKTLSNTLMSLTSVSGKRRIPANVESKKKLTVSPAAAVALFCLGFKSKMATGIYDETTVVCDIRVGEINPLEVAVKKSLMDTGKAQAAQATVDQVKVEGIDTNVAVMKELLFPVIESANRLQLLASWKDFFRSTAFLILSCYVIIRGWIQYLLPSVFLFIAIIMLWHRHFRKGGALEPFTVTPPQNRNAVEQLLTLQEAITQFESLIQAGNIVLLKVRALLLAILPQATERVALFLVFIAAVFAFVPPKYIFLVIFIECYTREMPCRKESSKRWIRRVREWWIRIPAAPVELVKPDECKKRK
ncbi:heat-inducible transcription repressor [Trifolium repens]|nr:heat-inducible transcription repressor [Trifolium repens]